MKSLNEYTSRYFKDKESVTFIAYHSTKDLDGILYDGYLDPEAEHTGECPWDVVWFTIKDDYRGQNVFSFQIDSSTFKEFDFRWMNDIHLVTSHKIDLMDRRLRLETVYGRNVDELYKEFYDGTPDGLDTFLEKLFEINDYSNENFVMKILQQYGFKRSDYFMDDESVDESKENQVKYVRQGIIPYGDGCAIGESDQKLNEIQSDEINLSSFDIKSELNPKFWIDGKINSRVRLKLLDLADEFFDSLSIKWVKPKDVVLTGSIANYNWSKYSDVDVHIIIDYSEVWDKADFVKDYFDSKKELWGQEHPNLKIYGFPVELYVEDENAESCSSGVYSLYKNEWIVEPTDFQDARINKDFVKEQSAKIITFIDKIEKKVKKEKDNQILLELSTKVNELFDKLHKLRQESLSKKGEMGTYNIIWKVLRRSEYLDKMWEIINNVYDKANSLS
jgi:predicted nucleotidyltransferase